MTPREQSRVNHVLRKTARQTITHPSAPEIKHATITPFTLLNETARHAITHTITAITFPSVPLGTWDVKLRRRFRACGASSLLNADTTRPRRSPTQTYLVTAFVQSPPTEREHPCPRIHPPRIHPPGALRATRTRRRHAMVRGRLRARPRHVCVHRLRAAHLRHALRRRVLCRAHRGVDRPIGATDRAHKSVRMLSESCRGIGVQIAPQAADATRGGAATFSRTN